MSAGGDDQRDFEGVVNSGVGYIAEVIMPDEPLSDSRRLVLESSESLEDSAVFAIGTDGSDPCLYITVAEEKADGSYNRMFDCTLSATMDQARQLRDWLIANIKD